MRLDAVGAKVRIQDRHKASQRKKTMGQSPISENENTQSDLDSRNATKERERGKERERDK